MCTGKRQTHIRNAPSSRTAVTAIGPYNEMLQCIRIRIGLSLPAAACRGFSGAARQRPWKGSLWCGRTSTPSAFTVMPYAFLASVAQ